MRRRLALLSLATTTLVVIAFLVPLGLLVRRQASDRARVAAERHAQSTASLIALAVSLDSSAGNIRALVGPLDDGVVVVLPDGSTIGEQKPGQGTLIGTASSTHSTISAVVSGGWELALPVIGRDGVAVVDVFVPDSQLTRGVTTAWTLLGLLGIALIGASVFVADRLGRRLVQPIEALAEAAHTMGEGDLDVSVEVSDPKEIREVGVAFNALAERLRRLLVAEREAVADLSHRLRTPLTSLRLQADKVESPRDREDVLAQVDRLEMAIDQLIVATRSGGGSNGRCHLDRVVEDRTAFWRVLADEQHRVMEVMTGADDVELGMTPDAVEALIDTLIGNVFAHTGAGVGFSVSTGLEHQRVWLQVADQGPGFPDASVVDRGVSGGGSTGLGLDIVRRTAELTGGTLEISDRPGAGAVVRVWFG